MFKNLHVLLTGGVGSRLWPLSRQSRPKQYLNIFSESTLSPDENGEVSRSLFELAVKRNSPFCDGLVVVGNQVNYQLSEKSLQNLNFNTYSNIVEATPRNTAAAIAFAAFNAQQEDILLVTPADHIIQEGEAYSKAILQAIELAKEGEIVTFGVKPTKPETGYGYIQYKQNDVIAFREKPDLKTAQSFLQQGDFLWNSGMFCFKAIVFLEELQKYSPQVYEKALNAWNRSKNGKLEFTTSMEIPSISVDYAVMEKSQKIKVVAADFEWNDMGSFEALYEYLKEQGQPIDENGNMVIGSQKYTAFVGLQNCILVSTPDANLVLSKKQSQGVKEVYQTLEKNNSELI